MNEANRFAVGFIVVLVVASGLITGGVIYSNSQVEYHRLSEYSCEQVIESFIDGTCIVQQSGAMFNHCYTVAEKRTSLEFRNCSQSGEGVNNG